MAEGINKDDLIKGDPIGEIKADLDAMAISLEKNDVLFKSIASTLKTDIQPVLVKTAKGLRAINKAEFDSEKLLREKLVNEEKLKKVRIAQERLTQAELRTKIANNKETERQETLKKRELAAKEKANKASARAKQLILDESNAYKKLTKATNASQAEFKRLAAQHGVNSKQARAAKVKFDALDKSLRKINKEARDGRRDVGRYSEAWRGAQSALGAVGVSIGIGFAVREGIEVLTEFDEKIADIMKTTGLLKRDAKELSADLFDIDTGTSITNLQQLVEAGGRLNITGKKDLLEFATAADKVFVALGDDLGGSADEIATNLGKISSNFGLEGEFGIAEGIEKVGSGINELSAKSKAAAEPILNFTNRMAGFASVIELADVQALGAFFDEGGQSVEVAATTMNKLLPSLATNFEKFAGVAGKTPEEFKKIAETAPIEALKLVALGARNNEEGVFKLTETLESFGVENARATSIVGLLTDKTERLTELQGLSAEAIEANTSLTDEFNVKNDTLGQTIGKATKEIKRQVIAFDEATGFTDKLKNSLKFLAENFGLTLSVGGKVLAFLAVYKTRLIVLNALNGKFGAGLKSIASLFTKGSENGKKFTGSLKSIGKALKGIGFAAAIAAVWELYKAWANVANKTQQYEDFLKRQEVASTKQGANAQKRSDDRASEFQDRVNEINTLISLGKLEASEGAKQIKALSEARKKAVDSDIKAVRKRKDAALDELEAVRKRRKDAFDEAGGEDRVRNLAGTGVLTGSDLLDSLNKIDAEFNEASAKVAGLTAKIVVYKGESDSLTQSLVDQTIEINNNGKGLNDNADKVDKNTQAYADLTDAINAAGDAEDERLELIEDFNISESEKGTQSAIDQATKVVEETGKIQTVGLENALEREEELKRAQIERIFLIRLEEATSAEAVALAIEQRNQALQLLDEEFYNKKKQALSNLQSLQDDFDAKELAKREKLEAEAAAKAAEIREELFTAYKNLQEALTQVLTEQIDERIALSKKEQDAAKSQQDFYEALAANGNITAEKSIAKQIEIQREAEEEQIRLAKVKQNVEMISAGLKTFTAAIEGGDSPAQALASTLTTTQVLASILGNLNFFAKGTDNASEGWSVVDEEGAEIHTDSKGNIKDFGSDKGARFKYLESGDKIITANKSSDILSKFDQIGMGQIVNKAQDSAGNSYDLMELNNTVRSLGDRIEKSQTKYEVNWETFASGTTRVNVTKTKGGDKRLDRYTVN